MSSESLHIPTVKRNSVLCVSNDPVTVSKGYFWGKCYLIKLFLFPKNLCNSAVQGPNVEKYLVPCHKFGHTCTKQSMCKLEIWMARLVFHWMPVPENQTTELVRLPRFSCTHGFGSTSKGDVLQLIWFIWLFNTLLDQVHPTSHLYLYSRIQKNHWDSCKKE